MIKNLRISTLALGMILASFAYDKKASMAQAPPADAARARELTLNLSDKAALKLVQIPAGKFLMGSPMTEWGRGQSEGLPYAKIVNNITQFEVTISKPFYLGLTHVTVDQYAAFVAETGQKHDEPGFKQTGDHPVVNVSWNDADAFCQWLSKKSGKTVVLPTEAQWEYACRAGTKTRFSFGDNDADLGDYAWYADNSMDNNKGARMTHPVRQKKPNAWGLYDMHGNAWQWCSDWYADYAGAGADPTGPKEGGFRVLRGGYWNAVSSGCRSAYRNWSNPYVRFDSRGFRVAVVAGAD